MFIKFYYISTIHCFLLRIFCLIAFIHSFSQNTLFYTFYVMIICRIIVEQTQRQIQPRKWIHFHRSIGICVRSILITYSMVFISEESFLCRIYKHYTHNLHFPHFFIHCFGIGKKSCHGMGGDFYVVFIRRWIFCGLAVGYT